jgi:hypothetical protein
VERFRLPEAWLLLQTGMFLLPTERPLLRTEEFFGLLIKPPGLLIIFLKPAPLIDAVLFS